jgi:hypothetical protein
VGVEVDLGLDLEVASQGGECGISAAPGFCLSFGSLGIQPGRVFVVDVRVSYGDMLIDSGFSPSEKGAPRWGESAGCRKKDPCLTRFFGVAAGLDIVGGGAGWRGPVGVRRQGDEPCPMVLHCWLGCDPGISRNLGKKKEMAGDMLIEVWFGF